MNELKKAIEVEKKAQALLDNLITTIAEEVRNNPLKDVQVVPNVTCQIAIVPFGSLRKGNLAPSTYIQPVQAAVVDQKLRGCKSVKNTLKALIAMVETGYIKNVSSNEIITLNENTLKVIKKHLESVGLTSEERDALTDNIKRGVITNGA